MLFVPFLLAIILIFACTETENNITEIEIPIVGQESQTTTVAKPDTIVESPTNFDKGPIFYIVEEMPDFQGKGIEGFRDWIRKNLRYPEIAANNGISGRVFVVFVVEFDGSISRVKVTRGVHPSLEQRQSV